MSYYKLLGLNKEPFSTSPDPQFFYHSTAHRTALARAEIAIRLKRGLSIIIGDVGTGKTTLSRALIQSFTHTDNFVLHLILDPGHKSEFQFLATLTKLFNIQPAFPSTMDYKEAIEKYLFQKGVNENKTIVLLIDEGQKLSQSIIEILRTLLNYETNEYKLLQLVILAQIEILPKISKIKNFMDRVALKYTINPLDEIETKKMIEFRLQQAGLNPGRTLFEDNAIHEIYELSQGYLRKITMICHDALEAIVMRDQHLVTGEIIQDLKQNRY